MKKKNNNNKQVNLQNDLYLKMASNGCYSNIIHSMLQYISHLIITFKYQKLFHNVGISIDLRVFSCLQEKLSCLSWSTYFHDFGVI